MTNEDVSNCVMMYLLILFISEELEPQLTFLLSIMSKTAIFHLYAYYGITILRAEQFKQCSMLQGTNPKGYFWPDLYKIKKKSLELFSMKINRVLVKKRIDFQNCSIILLVHVHYNSDLSFIPSAPYRKTFCEHNVLSSRTPKTGISTKISTSIFHNHYTSLYLRM